MVTKAKTEFTTEDGLVLKLRPVREALIELARMAVEKEFRDRREPIDVPTYTVTTITNETQTFPHVYDPDKGHDSLTVPDNPQQTAQNFAVWKQYTEATARLTEAQNEAAFMAQLEYGVEYEVPEDELHLLEKMLKKRERTYPDDPDERKALWLVYFGLSRMDKNMLGVELQIATMGKLVNPEQVEQFRHGIQDQMAKLASDALSESVRRVGELGSESEVSPVAGSEGMAPKTE